VAAKARQIIAFSGPGNMLTSRVPTIGGLPKSPTTVHSGHGGNEHMLNVMFDAQGQRARSRQHSCSYGSSAPRGGVSVELTAQMLSSQHSSLLLKSRKVPQPHGCAWNRANRDRLVDH
jgi:hypothetical protein